MLNLKIDLNAIQQNAQSLKDLTNCRLCAVIKANGYGHGIIQTAYALKNCASYFAVSTANEARALRNEGIKNPILMLGAFDNEFIQEAARLDIELSASCLSQLNALRETRIKTHLKLDTGMHRLGFSPYECEKIDFGGINLWGVYTHFAQNAQGNSFLKQQNQLFLEALKSFRAKNLVIHAAASGGALNGKEFCYDMVRTGIALYGYYPDPSLKQQIALKRAMSATSRIVQAREVKRGEYIGYGKAFLCNKKTNIAVISCGYGDGILRALSNKGFVVIGGKKCRIIGNICMDMLFAKARAHEGDIVEILGDSYTAEDMAADANTISYEILCGFSARASREYILKGGSFGKG